MNKVLDEKIRSAILDTQAKGIKLIQGAWFHFEAEGKLVACDALGSLIISHNRLPESACEPGLLRKPGFSRIVQEILGVDAFWLYRFNMGFDRNYQILIEHEDGGGCNGPLKKWSTKEDVSEYGIKLRKEFVK